MVIMRLPVLPEDEGRYQFIAHTHDEAETEAVLKELTESYWRREDFVVYED